MGDLVSATKKMVNRLKGVRILVFEAHSKGALGDLVNEFDWRDFHLSLVLEEIVGLTCWTTLFEESCLD